LDEEDIMSETKHTPGPWRVDETWPEETNTIRVKRNVLCVKAEPQRTIALCGHGSQDEAVANARLIAAAPELISALKAIQARINGVFDDPDLIQCGPLQGPATDIDRIARAAIAKAEGE
jgi:hypothetical protein